MQRPVGLLSLATASPPHVLPQSEVVQVARRILAPKFPHFERFAPVFESAGIRTRHSAAPVEWFFEPRNWRERADAYLAAAVPLYEQVARAALDAASLTGADIDQVVTVSSTGIATPTLEARCSQTLGLRTDVARAPLFGLGCAGGVTGLAVAARLAAASPGSRVLFVCLELCTLAFRTDQPTKADIVATALFGDGAAACVLQAGDEGFAQIVGTAEHTWPDTLDIMGWRVDREGLGVIFAQAIPPFVRAELRPVLEPMLLAQGLGLQDVDRFICHPGGTKVVEALEGALELGQGALAEEREVLADHGNMSSPTVLFVLERVRKTGLPRRSVLSALGPGFTASTATLLAA